MVRSEFFRVSKTLYRRSLSHPPDLMVGKCKIYSIDTFLKITIHSIHSIHHIVENIDVVRVLAVYSSVYRCLKVDG